jgi:hypothetical protein
MLYLCGSLLMTRESPSANLEKSSQRRSSMQLLSSAQMAHQNMTLSWGVSKILAGNPFVLAM